MHGRRTARPEPWPRRSSKEKPTSRKRRIIRLRRESSILRYQIGSCPAPLLEDRIPNDHRFDLASLIEVKPRRFSDAMSVFQHLSNTQVRKAAHTVREAKGSNPSRSR